MLLCSNSQYTSLNQISKADYITKDVTVLIYILWHKEFLEFSSTQYEELRDFSNEQVGIPLTASAMDPKSIDFLVELGKDFWRNGRGTP